MFRLTEKTKPPVAEVAKEDVSRQPSVSTPGGTSADVGDEVQRGREDSVHSLSFFPNELELKKGNETTPSMDVIQEEDNVREE